MAQRSIVRVLAALFSGEVDSDGVIYTEGHLQPTIHPNGTYAVPDTLRALAALNITGCDVMTAERLQCALINVAAAISKTFRDTPWLNGSHLGSHRTAEQKELKSSSRCGGSGLRSSPFSTAC
ncbi:hypothetical protein PENSUB_8374 [Penicillium subrubescens]|uniref:Uncharacterized protein n=2 Tax=Penicillium subrubescens TaxID=1316194 RepID=A0A1Q5TH52_9EURO|nr:hypothetical protein PENSUB_8374 [Penicillium subrubescens]